MTSADVAVRIKGVSHEFGESGDRFHVRALLDTNLDIQRGELLCLIGPSGCGKSTLLNMIDGLLMPTGGTVEVGGKVVRAPAARRTDASPSALLQDIASVTGRALKA